MSTQETERVVRGFYEAVFNSGDPAKVDEWVADDFVDHNPFPGQPGTRDGLAHFVSLFHGPLPDLKVELEDVIVGEDRAAVRWKARGTHKGQILNIPATGRPITLSGIDIIRVANGKVAEHWGHQDVLNLVREVGVVPALAMAMR